MSTKHTYEVVVGNVGVLRADNCKQANKLYREYMVQSKTEYGRVAGEAVTLLVDGRTRREYLGTIPTD
jgi:hypothetical protein